MNLRRMGVWAYGRMGVWAYGRAGVSACRRAGVSACRGQKRWPIGSSAARGFLLTLNCPAVGLINHFNDLS